MNVQALHSPIVRRFIETINEGRINDFLALFAADAIVIDGPTYQAQGQAAVQTWAQHETFDIQLHVNEVQEQDAEGLLIAVKATAQGGFSWQGTIAFTIRDEHIERLVFSPLIPES